MNALTLSQFPSHEELQEERQRLNLAKAKITVRPKMLGQDLDKPTTRLSWPPRDSVCGQCPQIATLASYDCCLYHPAVHPQLPLHSSSTFWETRLVSPKDPPSPGPIPSFSSHLTSLDSGSKTMDTFKKFFFLNSEREKSGISP